MSNLHNSIRQKCRIQQLPLSSRQGRDAIVNSNYLEDIVVALHKWGCQRVVLVHSQALDASTEVIKSLSSQLGSNIIGTKSGVGAHSPYEDVLAITKLLDKCDADVLISIGASSYSDACKIARLMQTNLQPNNYTVEGMEGLVDQVRGNTLDLKDPKVKLIVVPTSLSASEWNHISSASNPKTLKKQHFQSENAMPDLILLDPEVAATAPRKLWLSSGMRAVDHCMETICNKACTPEASKQAYGRNSGNTSERVEGVQGRREKQRSRGNSGWDQRMPTRKPKRHGGIAPVQNSNGAIACDRTSNRQCMWCYARCYHLHHAFSCPALHA